MYRIENERHKYYENSLLMSKISVKTDQRQIIFLEIIEFAIINNNCHRTNIEYIIF